MKICVVLVAGGEVEILQENSRTICKVHYQSPPSCKILSPNGLPIDLPSPGLLEFKTDPGEPEFQSTDDNNLSQKSVTRNHTLCFHSRNTILSGRLDAHSSQLVLENVVQVLSDDEDITDQFQDGAVFLEAIDETHGRLLCW